MASSIKWHKIMAIALLCLTQIDATTLSLNAQKTKDLDVNLPTQNEIDLQNQLQKVSDTNDTITEDVLYATPLFKPISQEIIDGELNQKLLTESFGISIDGKGSSGHSTLEIENQSAFRSPIEAAKSKYSAGVDLIYQLRPTSTTQINLFAGYGIELNSQRDGYTRAYLSNTSPDSGIYDVGNTSISTNRAEYIGVKIIIKKRHRIAITYKTISSIANSAPVISALSPFSAAISQFEGAFNALNNPESAPNNNTPTSNITPTNTSSGASQSQIPMQNNLSNVDDTKALRGAINNALLENYQAFITYYFLF